MLRSIPFKLTLWALLALTTTAVVSAATAYAYHLWMNSVAATPAIVHFLPVLIITWLLLLGAFLLLLRRLLNPCLTSLENAILKCRQISIDHLDMRFEPDNSVTETRLFIHEINDMLTRLENGARRIRQFSGDASHELRTPLTILRGETEVALRWGKTREEFRETLQSNMEEIDRMSRIIEDLLTLAKSESGTLPLTITKLSLSDLMQALYLQGRALAEPRQIDVQLNYNATSEIWIQGDDLRLRQMFLNLISNGIRYSHDHGQVTIDVSLQGTAAVVAIKDNGIGIAKEHLPYIFERFYRTDEARNRADGGTGLGLAIVKGIIDAHHGEIIITSEPGVGSTFLIKLPIAGPQSTDPVPETPATNCANTQQRSSQKFCKKTDN